MSSGTPNPHMPGRDSNPLTSVWTKFTPGSIAASVIGATGVVLLTVLKWNGKIGTPGYIVLLSLTTIVCLYLAGPNEWIQLRPQGPEGPRNTPRMLALSLLGLFSLTLGMAGAVAAYETSDMKKEWLDLFKSGFLLLGGGVTTVIGYYFGSRETRDAAQTAAASVRESLAAGADRGETETRPTGSGPLRSTSSATGGGGDVQSNTQEG
jgi:hypothetical protein